MSVHMCRASAQIFLQATFGKAWDLWSSQRSNHSFTGRSCLHGEYDTDRPSEKNTPQAKQQKDIGLRSTFLQGLC